MATNVEVKRTGNENAMGLIRRFTRRVQSAGILPRVRSIRYYSRPKSRFLRKRQALKKIARKQLIEELIKEGKLQERTPGRRYGR